MKITPFILRSAMPLSPSPSRFLVTFHQSKKHEVWLSSCSNIYYNLALEDWIYSCTDFSDGQTLMLLWRNKPCVVIGRHQNPWVECNLRECKQNGVHVARRMSGGGTVYHDLGNLNCTFFTQKKKYDRSLNLQMLADALSSRWKINVGVSERDDLMLDNRYKISGTAAKLGRNVAYHHCTLLFNVNTKHLSQLLRSDLDGLQSKATESVRSPVRNLQDAHPTIEYHTLVDAIASQYYQYYGSKGEATFLDPTNEKDFPGLYDKYQQIKQWSWVYGKTPNFAINRVISRTTQPVTYKLNISKGSVVDIKLTSELNVSEEEAAMNDMLGGIKCNSQDIQSRTDVYAWQSLIQSNQTIEYIISDLLTILV